MPTNREIYFQSIKQNNPYINHVVIRSLLVVANSFVNDFDLTINFDEEIKDINLFNQLFNQVLSGEPYQYVIHKASFLGNEYYVDNNVLIPRQETEQLVLQVEKLSKSIFNNKRITLCDMCTGSGVIGVELANKLNANIYLTDIDENALNVAKKNSLSVSEKLNFLLGSLCSPIIENSIKIDVLVCNPPYIENVEEIDKQVWDFEPHKALLAFPATSPYEEIFKHYKEIMNDTFIMAFEIGEDMEESLTELIKKYFTNVRYQFEKDLYNKSRFLYIIKDMRNDYKKAASVLLRGGVVGFATETVMGLGVVYNNFDSYNRLNEIKRRPEDKPYSLMIGDTNEIDKYAVVNDRNRRIVNKFLPGPLTVLLPVKESVPSWVTHGGSTIGIRVPESEISLMLLKEVGVPLLVPSANRSGENPCMTSNEVKDVFKNELDYVLEGNAEGGLPSTLVDLTKNEIRIIRQGPITMEMIESAIKGE